MAEKKRDPNRDIAENWINKVRPKQMQLDQERTKKTADGKEVPYKVDQVHFRGKDGATYFADISKRDVVYNKKPQKEGEPEEIRDFNVYVSPSREEMRVRRMPTKEEQAEGGAYTQDAANALREAYGENVHFSESGKSAYFAMPREDFMSQLRADVQARIDYGKKMGEAEKAAKQIEGVEAAVAVEEKAAGDDTPEMV